MPFVAVVAEVPDLLPVLFLAISTLSVVSSACSLMVKADDGCASADI